jgi:DeoR/GlpR family transcriptional regulator of sugar metabolism
MTDKMSKAERQRRLAAALRANPGLRLGQIAEHFEVSVETVRRDMNELADAGVVIRTYGGAAPRALATEPSVRERDVALRWERERIGSAAAQTVKAGEVLLIDAGSTTVHFARQLGALDLELTVLTNCLAVADLLAPAPSMRVILCPGDVDTHEGGTFGPATTDFLDHYHADVAFIGAGGITGEGITDAHSPSAAVKRAMIERASRTVLLADHEKAERTHLEVVCPLTAIHTWVTDAAPPSGLARALAAAGMRVLLADEVPSAF